jgi:hypothetical protein
VALAEGVEEPRPLQHICGSREGGWSRSVRHKSTESVSWGSQQKHSWHVLYHMRKWAGSSGPFC